MRSNVLRRELWLSTEPTTPSLEQRRQRDQKYPSSTILNTKINLFIIGMAHLKKHLLCMKKSVPVLKFMYKEMTMDYLAMVGFL